MTDYDYLILHLAQFQQGGTSVESFCGEFERIYNLELDKSSIPERHRSVMKNLFDAVVWYSPIPDDRDHGFLNEDQIRAAVQTALESLSQ